MNSYTEEEAKSKWCPFANVGYAFGVNCNRDQQDEGPSRFSNCLASGCACWNWSGDRTVWQEDGKTWDETSKSDKGYCGLARKT